MNIFSLPRSLSWIMLPAALMFAACGDEPTITPIDDDKNLVSEHSAEVQIAWNELYLNVERYADGYRPGPAPRSLAYMGLAAYEACITGMPDYNSLRSRYAGLVLPDPEAGFEYHWSSVVHGVYSAMMPYFFVDPHPDAKADWDDLVQDLNSTLAAEAGQSVYNTSYAYGRSVGEAMWTWSTTDTEAHDSYKDPFAGYNWEDHYDSPGDWVPTFPGPGKPMFPYMGKWRTFAISSEDKVSYPPSAYFMEYSTDPHSEYYSQAIQVYSKNAAQDYVTEWIGEFWSDDLVGLTFSPGPRWVAVANQVIAKDKPGLEVSLETYAKVGMAINDAAVACWHSKYLYNVERPVTYILEHIDPNYKTNLHNPVNGDIGFNPSFPAYPSGHSTMGAAGAEALASMFGYAYSMTDRCHQGRTQFEGTPRTFGSFLEMAQENAWSRILLGVHYRMDSDEGVRFGTVIGRKVNMLPWKK